MLASFPFGINPYITRPIGDTLFDEKIVGSIHFTPGSAYDDCFNGKQSAVHWDPCRCKPWNMAAERSETFMTRPDQEGWPVHAC